MAIGRVVVTRVPTIFLLRFGGYTVSSAISVTRAPHHVSLLAAEGDLKVR